MDRSISRRDFLKLGALALTTLAANPYHEWLLPEERATPVGVGRVTTQAIRIYNTPSLKGKHLRWQPRDKLLRLYDETRSPFGPQYNPRWYWLGGGYAHSAYLQRVDQTRLNPPLDEVPAIGQLAEVTVPYVRSQLYSRSLGWRKLYRLYFGSVHWITRLVEGPDGEPWYGITDDLVRVVHYVPAIYLRPIEPEELTPISEYVPPQEKRIEISVAQQMLTAYEGDQVALKTRVSTGRYSRGPSPNGIPTDTPLGKFNISLKLPSRHMGDGVITSDLEAYELPGVPWVGLFHVTGVGFHGTYWHDNFGARMSAGCVNMRSEDAKWLYRWTTPYVEPGEWHRLGRGTLIHVY